MYLVDVTVKGDAPLLQHRFPIPDLVSMTKGGKKQTGAKDYTEEWREHLYVAKCGQIYQPATHFEGALVKSAVNFKIIGRRGKTYKDLFRAAVFVAPEEILHGIDNPDELDTDADKQLYLDIRPAVVQRARIVRVRPAFSLGWLLDFQIEVIDDQINSTLLQDVLVLAGKTVGIGDFRPKFGRFSVVKFEVVE